MPENDEFACDVLPEPDVDEYESGPVVTIGTRDETIIVDIRRYHSGNRATLSGWDMAREDLGMNKHGNPPDGVELLHQEPRYYDDDRGGSDIMGYDRVVLQFESVDALDRARDRLYDSANERFEYGDTDADKVQDFAGLLPTEFDVREQEAATDGGVDLSAAWEQAHRASEDWRISEKVEGVTYSDDNWMVLFSFVDADGEDIVFDGYSEVAVSVDVLDESEREALQQHADGDETVFDMVVDRLEKVPDYILQRLDEAGYQVYGGFLPPRCSECGADRSRFNTLYRDLPSVEHCAIDQWACPDCENAIEFDGVDGSWVPDTESSEREASTAAPGEYAETGDEHHYEGYCPSCGSEETLFETVRGDPDRCLTCGQLLPQDAGWYEDELDITTQAARVLSEAFYDPDGLVKMCRDGEALTDYEGVGEATARSIWRWFHEDVGGRVEATDTLALTDDGLVLPDWLVGYSGRITVEKPGGTSVLTGQGSWGEIATVLTVYPDEAPSTQRLSAGQVALRAKDREAIYDIDDQREEVDDAN